MLLKLDENLGRSHVEILRNAGYETDRVHDQGMSGWPDSDVWKRVCDEGRFSLLSISILPTCVDTGRGHIQEYFYSVQEIEVALQLS